MASEKSSGVNEERIGLDDSEPENEEYYSQRTYDRQSEGTVQSQNLVSRGSSNIIPETDRMSATYLVTIKLVNCDLYAIAFSKRFYLS